MQGFRSLIFGRKHERTMLHTLPSDLLIVILCEPNLSPLDLIALRKVGSREDVFLNDL